MWIMENDINNTELPYVDQCDNRSRFVKFRYNRNAKMDLLSIFDSIIICTVYMSNTKTNKVGSIHRPACKALLEDVKIAFRCGKSVNFVLCLYLPKRSVFV